MADKYSKRRIASSSVTTVISLSLVLFLLGLLGMIVLSAKKVSEHVKENIGFQIYLKDEAKEVDINKLKAKSPEWEAAHQKNRRTALKVVGESKITIINKGK